MEDHRGKSAGDKVTFDFSPKGGPTDLTGVYSKDEMSGVEYIAWPDSNKWSTNIDPKADMFQKTVVGSYQGQYLDSKRYVPGSFTGIRVFAETPAHVLQIIGYDAGTRIVPGHRGSVRNGA